MFNRVLIESLLNVEDEVRIIVTEIITNLLKEYLQLPDYEKWISQLLVNLQDNLEQSDEIESSAISVFNLINLIIDAVPSLERISLNFDLSIFCPFNFHKIINVRYSYNQIVNKCLQSLKFSEDELVALTRLTI